METIVLGAGITGLTAGHKHGYPIFEAKSVPGGICRTYRLNGYTFENGGGHWIFGTDHSMRGFLSQFDSFKAYKKDAGVYLNTIINGSIQRFGFYRDRFNKNTMRRWFKDTYSNGLNNLFFFPFNDKYTNGLYHDVIMENKFKQAGAYNEFFIYPEHGLDHVIDKIAAKCSISYGHTVTSINMRGNRITFNDDTTMHYDKIISTIPLNELLRLCGLTADLPHSSVTVINIGAEKGPNFPKEQWLYVPFSRSGYHRIGFYSNVDPMFAPRDHCSIYVESSGQPAHIDDVAYELTSNGIIDKIHQARTDFIPVAYTYLYPDTDISMHLNDLRENGIISTGRYGKWKFQGIADSIADGLSDL